MAKDPAFLFYSSDFLTGTSFMTDEQVGKYIRLLCLQHQHGRLKEIHMIYICKSYDEDIFGKFEKDGQGLYYNPRLEEEANKRKNYTQSRRDNVMNRYKNKKIKSKSTYVKDMNVHMNNHMENENEDENININKDVNINKKERIKKTKYGNYKHVLLDDVEYEKLIDKLGVNGTLQWINTLDEGIELKGYKYKSHYLAILKWASNEKKDNKQTTLAEKRRIVEELY